MKKVRKKKILILKYFRTKILVGLLMNLKKKKNVILRKTGSKTRNLFIKIHYFT